MYLTSIYESALERLGYKNTYRYEHLDSLHDAFDVLRNQGSRLKQKIIAGLVVSVILVVVIILAASPTSLSSSQESLNKWWHTEAGSNNTTDHDGKSHTYNHTCEAMPDRIQVTILETVGAHDEVDAALVHSLGSQSNANVALYQKRPRYGIDRIIGAFPLTGNLTGPKHPDNFTKARTKTDVPDVLVLTTCEDGIRHAKSRLAKLLKQGKTRLVCVVHHADKWALPEKEAGIRAWVDKGRVEFWTLSHHTSVFLKNVIAKWDGSPAATIRVFVPVFPVAPSPGSNSPQDELSIALQGDYDPQRRDYQHIFQRLGAVLHDGARHDQNISLHLLGQGTRPPVPEDVRDHVFFDQGLNYTDFYTILSRVSAVLSGFASSEYLDRKASSSVPAALIAGTPLVATQAILDAYTYIDADSVWLQADEESDFDVVSRILTASPAERAAKKEKARAKCKKIVQENTVMVGDWIQEALYTMHCKNAEDQ